MNSVMKDFSMTEKADALCVRKNFVQKWETFILATKISREITESNYFNGIKLATSSESN